MGKRGFTSATFGLAVYLDRPAGLLNEPVELQEALHEFFRHRAELSRHRLRELFRRGRTSLVIGLCALGVSLTAGNLVGEFFSNHIAGILSEGLLIGGWVAMWRPTEIFLYDGRFTANPSKVPKLIAYRPHHLTIGRGVSGCFKNRSIVS